MSQQQETMRALEKLRQNYYNLANTLGKVRRDLEVNDPLPTWPSILAQIQLTNHAFLSLQNTLRTSSAVLQSAHPFPLPTYPGRSQEDLITQLLRKKLDPQVEDWISKGETHASTIPGINSSIKTPTEKTSVENKAEEGGLNVIQLEELWEWAGPEANRIAREDIGAEGWDDVFTLAESEAGIENVVTGLRRKLWESEGEESDDDDNDANAEKKEVKGQNSDAMDVDIDGDADKNLEGKNAEEGGPKAVDQASAIMMMRKVDESRPPMSLEAVLRFTLTGQMPPVSSAGPDSGMGMPIRR